MPNYGFAADPSGNTVCGIRKWPDIKCSAGYLLFCYGSLPDNLSVCPDSHKKCLNKLEALLQNSLEKLAAGTGTADRPFVAASIQDAMQKANAQIYQIAAYLGQSICIGGAVTFFHEEKFLVLPFGGGDACLWSKEKQLTHIGEPVTNEYITKDPIGSHANWTGTFWNGTLQPGVRLLLSSNPIRKDPAILDAIQSGSNPGSHSNTVSLLLRQILEQNGIPPVAVMDIHY